MSGRPWHVAVVVENVALGVDTRLRKQVDDLLALGYEVSVVTRRHADNAPYRDRARLHLLEHPAPPEGEGTVSFVREYAVAFGWACVLLLRLRVRRRVDVVQLCQPPDIYFPLAWLLRWSGARVVVDQRDLMPELLVSRGHRDTGPLVRLLRWLERRSQRAAHRTVTVNDYLRDRLVGAGAAPVAVSVARNGPVLDRVGRTRPAADAQPEAGFVVVWAGKIGPQDRVDQVVRLAEQVVHARGRRDCRFVVLGDGECLDQLRALTHELDLEPWVSFTGWVEEAALFELLATADVGVDTSLQVEVSPVKVMEYMAFGLPVVCFDLQETRRLAEGAAVLVRPGDLDALTDAVLALLDDRRRRELLGAHGRARVADELAWEQQTTHYLAAVAPR